MRHGSYLARKGGGATKPKFAQGDGVVFQLAGRPAVGRVVEVQRPTRSAQEWRYTIALVQSSDGGDDAAVLSSEELMRSESQLVAQHAVGTSGAHGGVELDGGVGLPAHWFSGAERGEFDDSTVNETADAALKTAPSAGSGHDDGFGVFGPQTPQSLVLGRPEWARGGGASSVGAPPSRGESYGRVWLAVDSIMFVDPDHRPTGSWQGARITLAASDTFEDERRGEPTPLRTPPCEADDGWVAPGDAALWLEVPRESTTLHLQLWFPRRGGGAEGRGGHHRDQGACIAQADLRFEQFCEGPTQGTRIVSVFAVQQQPQVPGSRRAPRFAIVPGSSAVGVVTVRYEAMVRGATGVAAFESFGPHGSASAERVSKAVKSKRGGGDEQATADRAREQDEQEAAREKLNEQQDTVLKAGTYQLIVHVLETRDLEPAAHACVHVSILDQHGHTAPKRRIGSSASIGETLRIQLNDRSVDEIRDSVIKLRVADAVLGLAVGGTIGEFSVDLMLVYRKQHHEIHEQWVGLSRAPNAKDLMQQQDSNLAKLRGYLLVSIAVLGPGDKQHLRSRDEERLAAKKTKVAAVGRGVDSLVMMPPSIKQKVVFLELQLLRAEHLPRVEMFTKFTRALGKLLDNSAIQPYIKASFGGNEVTSKLVVCDGSAGGMISAEFWEKLKLPVLVHERNGELLCATDTIRIELRDFEAWPKTDRIVGSVTLHWKSLQRSRTTYAHARYYPVYGAPVAALQKQGTLLGKMDKKRGRAVAAMSEHPNAASQYHGRLLMSVTIDDSVRKAQDILRPSTYKRDQTSLIPVGPADSPNVKAKKAQIFRSLSAPNTVTFTLRAAILCGSELPPFRDALSKVANNAGAAGLGILKKFGVKGVDSLAQGLSNTRYFVRVVMGNVVDETASQLPVQGGGSFVVWSHVLTQNILLPKAGADIEMEIKEDVAVKFAVTQNSTWVRTTTTLVGAVKPGDRVRLYTARAYFTLHVMKVFPDGFSITRPFPGRSEQGLEGKMLALNVAQKKRLTQLPDVLIQLCYLPKSGVKAPVPESDVLCFKRYSIVELMDYGLKMHEHLKKGVSWEALTRDDCMGNTDDTKPSGTLLMKVGVGLAEEAAMSSWDSLKDVCCDPSRILAPLREKGLPDRLVTRSHGLFTVAVHVYMVRGLPALDNDGTSDPRLTLNLGHVRRTLATRYNTLSPEYFETVKMTCFLPIDPATGQPSCFAPQLTVEFSDVDDFSAPQYMCGATVGMLDPRVRHISEFQSASEIPIREGPDRVQWYPLHDASGGSSGRLLMAITLVQRSPRTLKIIQGYQQAAGAAADLLSARKEGAALNRLIHETSDLLPAMPSLIPKINQTYKFIEIIALGVRGLTRRPPFIVNAPFAEFDLGLDDSRGYAATDASKAPTPADANFLKRIVMPIELPEEPLFAPELSLIVRDREFGGLAKPIIGRATIALKEKLPWNVRDYRPPQSQAIGAASSFVSGADGGFAVQREVFASDSEEDEFAHPDVVGQTLQGWGNMRTFEDGGVGTGGEHGDVHDRDGSILRVGSRVSAPWRAASGRSAKRMGEVEGLDLEANTVDVLFPPIGHSPGAEPDFRTDIPADEVVLVHTAYGSEGNLLHRSSRVVRRWIAPDGLSEMYLDALVLSITGPSTVNLLYKRPVNVQARPAQAASAAAGGAAGEAPRIGPFAEESVDVRYVTEAQVFDRNENGIVAGRPVTTIDAASGESAVATRSVKEVYAGEGRVVLRSRAGEEEEDVVVQVGRVEAAAVHDHYGRQLRVGLLVRRHATVAGGAQSSRVFRVDEIKFGQETVSVWPHDTGHETDSGGLDRAAIARQSWRADEAIAVIDGESPYGSAFDTSVEGSASMQDLHVREKEFLSSAAAATAAVVAGENEDAAALAASDARSATKTDVDGDDDGLGIFPVDFEIPDPAREQQRAEQSAAARRGEGDSERFRVEPSGRDGAASGGGGHAATFGEAPSSGPPVHDAFGNVVSGGGGAGRGGGDMSATAVWNLGGTTAAGAPSQFAAMSWDDGAQEEEYSEESETSSDADWPDSDSVATPSFSEESEDSDAELDPPAWMVGREDLTTELEWEQTENALSSPFESYYLYSGSREKKTSLLTGRKKRSTWRTVGVFKGLIRVMKTRDDPPLFENLDAILHPKDYTLRVYIVAGEDISAAGGKRPSPYLKLQCGPKAGAKARYISDKRGYHRHETNPAFNKCYELTATLPGPPLTIEAWHYNDLMPHTKIGDTTIALEERWFNTKWRAEGKEHENAVSSLQRGPVRHRPKALEHRALEIRSSRTIDDSGGETFMNAGRLKMWIEILDDQQADRFQLTDLTPPERKEIEVRIIIWRVKDVPITTLSGRIDLKVACWFSGREHERQETDVHLRADKGIGNFNWRMKFTIKYPWHQDDDHREEAHTRLQIQLLSMKAPLVFVPLAEVMLSLEAAFRKVMKRGESVNLFQGRGGGETKKSNFLSAFREPEAAPNVAGEEEPDLEAGGGESEHVPLLVRRGAGRGGGGGGAAAAVPYEVRKSAARQRAEKEEKAAAIQKLREQLGMGATVHPNDADWLTLTRSAGGLAGTPMVSGRILMSVEVMPIAVAEQRQNARGRHAPNEFPHLPPPSGRIRFGWSIFNPFYLFRELLGDAMCVEITTAVTVILTVVIVLSVLIGASQVTSAVTDTIMFLETNIPAPLSEWLKWFIFACLGVVTMLCCFSVGFCWKISSDSHKAQYANQVHDDYYDKMVADAAGGTAMRSMRKDE